MCKANLLRDLALAAIVVLDDLRVDRLPLYYPVPGSPLQARPLWVAGWVARPRYEVGCCRNELINKNMFSISGLYDIVLM